MKIAQKTLRDGCGLVRGGCLQVIEIACGAVAGRFAGRCGLVACNALILFAGRLRVSAGWFPYILSVYRQAPPWGVGACPRYKSSADFQINSSGTTKATATNGRKPKTGETKLMVIYRNGYIDRWTYTADQLRWTNTGSAWDISAARKA